MGALSRFIEESPSAGVIKSPQQVLQRALGFIEPSAGL